MLIKRMISVELLIASLCSLTSNDHVISPAERYRSKEPDSLVFLCNLGTRIISFPVINLVCVAFRQKC